MLVALSALAVASWQHPHAAEQPASPTDLPASPATPLPAPLPARALAAVQATATPTDTSRQIELPDGTSQQALNGAVECAPLAMYWGNTPWSPIVDIERSSAGIDWFRHENGSYSTTQMVWRTDLGRFAAMTRVAHQGPAPAKVAPPTPQQAR